MGFSQKTLAIRLANQCRKMLDASSVEVMDEPGFHVSEPVVYHEYETRGWKHRGQIFASPEKTYGFHMGEIISKCKRLLRDNEYVWRAYVIVTSDLRIEVEEQIGTVPRHVLQCLERHVR
jgi:hypothetical protein